MGFLTTEENELIRKNVREFAEKYVKPIAAEIDANHRFPAETVAKMAEQGFFGMSVPEEYGGDGSSYLDYIIAVEELSRVCGTHGIILSAQISLCMWAILRYGTEEQKKKYIPDLAAGKKFGAFALTEPGAGTDAASQLTVAKKEGDHYVVNGSKVFITNGGVADIFVIFALTDPSQGTKGISGFIVEKSYPGFEVGQLENKMGICASSTTELFFKDMKVPAENMLGKEGKGFGVAMGTLDGGRIGVGAQALGIAQGALEAAIAYAKERKQFKKPIIANQGIQWYLAEMQTKIEAARLLVYRAAEMKQAGLNFSVAAAEAKYFASETAMYVTTKAVQIFGGVGYTKNFPVERMMRDAKITEIYEGTNEVQKMVIGGSLAR